MINQSDIEGRLRLLRYGLIVLVVVTFLVTLLAPYAYLSGAGQFAPPITEFLGNAVLFTVVVAVLAVVVYLVYSMLLKRSSAS
jgi:hypothetical protein